MFCAFVLKLCAAGTFWICSSTYMWSRWHADSCYDFHDQSSEKKNESLKVAYLCITLPSVCMESERRELLGGNKEEMQWLLSSLFPVDQIQVKLGPCCCKRRAEEVRMLLIWPEGPVAPRCTSCHAKRPHHAIVGGTKPHETGVRCNSIVSSWHLIKLLT